MTKLLLAFLAMGLALPAMAADSSSGCGLGWAVSSRNSLVSSAVRATTNGLFFNSTFGMTSGTSGCTKHSIVQIEKEQIYYTEANRENLVVEMAQGQGEFVDAYARVLGCSGESVNTFRQVTQKSYPAIVTSSDVSAAQILHNLKEQMRKSPTLAASCGV
jgi:hypothetical protein